MARGGYEEYLEKQGGSTRGGLRAGRELAQEGDEVVGKKARREEAASARQKRGVGCI